MTNIQTRNTSVISVSVEPSLLKTLDGIRKKTGQTRSNIIAELIKKYTLEDQWKKIRQWGNETAKKFKVTSEDDIDRILHYA